MIEDTTEALQSLLDRLEKGTVRPRASCWSGRISGLRKLAGRILTGSFPVLRTRHDLGQRCRRSLASIGAGPR